MPFCQSEQIQKRGYYQWFHFRASDVVDRMMTYTITNAGGASYAPAWNGYRTLASYDGDDWFRVPTQYDGSNLTFEFQATEDAISFAFFVPYSEDQRKALLEQCEKSPLVQRRELGKSYQGRPLDLLVIGDENQAQTKTWIVTRQHAGEPMAEWAAEGLIHRLLDETDSVAQELLSKTVFYICPNMNPDGSYLGNLRANARGVDLNRAWNKTGEDFPEIRIVCGAIAENRSRLLPGHAWR